MEAKNLTVCRNARLAEHLYLMEFEGAFTPPALPGQFIHIKIDGLFLRRPFSVAGQKNNRLAILYKVVGKGTEILARKKGGETLNAIGPLGKSFPVIKKWKNVYLAGGGTGIAPLIFLADKLSGEDVKITFFYGAKSRGCIGFEILPAGINFVFTTEDGSYGDKGLLDRAVCGFIGKNGRPDVIYGGGPAGLLKKIGRISEDFSVPAFVSLENRMACGTGICYGCVTKIKTGSGWEYMRICKEGPVFNTKDIKWD
ncbi:MAG: dihydroorotate dehydrogenase electron transfer subunit [Candidatus Omnitrophica bacterium]|nr:dihydroorotate dehydrogenase electron transfer subunit [Candidatus Omnitrophota bacterium]